MGESYPLFQSALTSTPFSGTLADTSTPTPAGQQPQLPQTPQPTEAPGASGNQERAKKIAQDRTLIQSQLKELSTMQWKSSSKWTRAHNLALYGRDVEPPEMLYRRHAAMSSLLNQDAALAQEERLNAELSPGEAETQKEQAKLKAQAGERLRRKGTIDELNALHKANGLPEVDPAISAQFIEGGYGIDKAAGETDPIKALTGAAELGSKTSSGFENDPSIPAPLRAAVLAGRKAETAKRAEKKTDESDDTKYAGFKTPSALFNAMQSAYSDEIDQYRQFEDYQSEDPLTHMPMTKQRRAVPTKDQIREARASVAQRFPGYEKYFPNYVEKGATDVPVVTNDGQQDLTPEQKRAAAKAAAAARLAGK